MFSKKFNLTLLILTAILVIFGLFMVTSAGMVISQERFGQSLYFAKHQVLNGLLPGLILGFIAFVFPLSFLRRYALLIFLFGVVLMILVYIPGIGAQFGGARRWINFDNFNFQPSELFKLAFVVYLAAFFEKTKELRKNHPVQGLFAFLAVLAVVGLLIGLQPDIGTLGVFALTALSLYFLARAPLSHIFALSALGFAVLAFFVKIFPHAAQRVQVLFNPQAAPKGIGYQMDQSLIALGSGGILGQGLAQGKQKFLYLPQPANDSIAAVIGEELGFLGLIILVSVFLAFAFQGLKIARNAPDEFLRLLAAGVTCLITVQAFINILAIIGLIPLTGVTLPFISYGGTSLAVSLVGVGILLNISKYSINRP